VLVFREQLARSSRRHELLARRVHARGGLAADTQVDGESRDVVARGGADGDDAIADKTIACAGRLRIGDPGLIELSAS